jgi:hypothetical protein
VKQHGVRIPEDIGKRNEPRGAADGGPAEFDAHRINDEVALNPPVIVREQAPPPLSPGSVQRERGHCSLSMPAAGLPREPLARLNAEDNAVVCRRADYAGGFFLISGLCSFRR